MIVCRGNGRREKPDLKLKRVIRIRTVNPQIVGARLLIPEGPHESLVECVGRRTGDLIGLKGARTGSAHVETFGATTTSDDGDVLRLSQRIGIDDVTSGRRPTRDASGRDVSETEIGARPEVVDLMDFLWVTGAEARA